MFENYTNKILADLDILLRMYKYDELERNGGDIYKIECFLNKVLDHVDILKSNLPYEEHMSEDVEDEVVLCEKLMDMALKWVDMVKPLYYLDNSFDRFHVEPEFEESYFSGKINKQKR